MKKKSWYHILPILILALAFPLFVGGMGLLLKVDTIDISERLEPAVQEGESSVYRLTLPAVQSGERCALMFETTGNVIQLRTGDELLYEYGSAYAAAGRMIGRVFVHAPLPESAWDGSVSIRLTPVDRNASASPERLELCPQEESTRYYLTNRTPGLLLALVLISMAFCVPFFLMLGNEHHQLGSGLLFSSVLLCFALLLLDNGGHFLVFWSNQHGWMYTIFLARSLLPVFFLLYFRQQERGKLQRGILTAGALIHLLYILTALCLTHTGSARFCDLAPVYNFLLVMDGGIGIYGLCRSLRQKRLSRSRIILLGIAIVWVLFVVVGNFLPGSLRQRFDLPHFDLPCACAVALFYVLCGLYGESLLHIRQRAQEKDERIEALEETGRTAISTAAIARALSERYESIYSIDLETSAYTCYYESSAHGELGVASSGEDFFAVFADLIPQTVHPDDRVYSLQMLSREAVLQGTSGGEYHSFIHRVLTEDGTPVYHQIRAVRRSFSGREWILLGIRDVDEVIRREMEHAAARESMLQKEMNHLEAILASAAGYLEANLSRNVLLEYSHNGAVEAGRGRSFTGFVREWSDQIVAENKEKFLQENSPQNLIAGFERGERRTSVYFSTRDDQGRITPCRQIMYPYRDKASGDVMCFDVIYDLTEQQRQEKERKELEDALRMSRLRVFSSQMQPHFLYNALGSIQEIVLDDPEYASQLLGDFTIHLRSSIRAMASDDPIPFGQELENINAYVNIEKMRFGEKLKIRFDIQTRAFSILPLSIQPLVENAIRHGVYERGAQGGTVTISSQETEKAWVVQVEDDGVGFDVNALWEAVEGQNRDSTGLKNLVFRLDKVMGAAVDIQSTPGVGTCVTVTVPKEGESKCEQLL